MLSTRSEASYNLSGSSQKSYRHDYGKSQSVTERQGSTNEAQNDKLCHSEADNTVLPSNRAETSTRSRSGHFKCHTEGIQQLTSPQRVSDPSKSLGKLHELFPDFDKVSGPS
ncbi:hypothetical protein O181_002308 [Austropuccinia psidii MF-1]|uniref:Uncharacterized protein n=1 Tax=Austropuccinia psidii MF-1 TaxID=1389203 RepID=A0A9Q3GCI1_9BASI|nr:hypothetical protein [Austropuccinia psidii MF-1]